MFVKLPTVINKFCKANFEHSSAIKNFPTPGIETCGWNNFYDNPLTLAILYAEIKNIS